jgi:hypothetical protein
MKTPGFTAECSLRQSGKGYQGNVIARQATPDHDVVMSLYAADLGCSRFCEACSRGGGKFACQICAWCLNPRGFGF